MGICYIFGAGEGLPETFIKKEDDLVIAADAGLCSLKKLGVKPDIAVGDFDSLGFLPVCREVIKHPVMKDDTDMLLAVKTGFERGYSRFMLFGGAGGRALIERSLRGQNASAWSQSNPCRSPSPWAPGSVPACNSR